MQYSVKQHTARRFIGSCRASLASNAAPWNYIKGEAIKASLKHHSKQYKMLSYRRETALQDAL